MGGVSTKMHLPLDSGFTSIFSFQITNPYQYSTTEYSYPGARSRWMDGKPALLAGAGGPRS